MGIIPPAVYQSCICTGVSACFLHCFLYFLFQERELLQGHRRETYDKIMLAMDSVGLGIVR